MPFTLIKGSFHVTGYAPDGDSIRFQAKHPALWAEVKGPPVRLNARGHAQLRFEAIDTLETHYQGYHQPPRFAEAATDFLLDALGIHAVEWDISRSMILKAQDGVPGFILTREIEKNHRPVAFVYTGKAKESDGAQVLLKAGRLKDSVNYRLIESGLAYPTYYKGLFPDLRETFTAAVAEARAENKGLWPVDKTNAGFKVTGLAGLLEDDVILPKLFRRIVSYIGTGGDIAGFTHYLARDPDPILLLDSGHFTNLDTVVALKGKRVRLLVPPERIVFIPK